MSTQRQQYGSHPLGGMLKIEDFGRYVRIQSTLVEGAFFILGGGKVDGSTVFDYYYGDESSQFSFYRIPRQLVAGQQSRKSPRTQSCCMASCLTEWACLPGTAGMMTLAGLYFLHAG